MTTFEQIRPGDRVTILTPHGSKLTGRAVMFNRATGCWVLNLGGRIHGTPGIASEKNTLAVKQVRRDKFAAQAEIINGGMWAGHPRFKPATGEKS